MPTSTTLLGIDGRDTKTQVRLNVGVFECGYSFSCPGPRLQIRDGAAGKVRAGPRLRKWAPWRPVPLAFMPLQRSTCDGNSWPFWFIAGR